MDFKIMSQELQPRLLAAIKRLVAIESVRGEPETDAPYGPGPKAALEEALQISKELGFETVNLDHKIGYAQWTVDPSSTDYYGVFGHVDVVPIGEGWQFPPLDAVICNNRIYGRGVLDNKGPILSNLFALAALRESGYTFKKNIRIVFGTNEETGFGCVKHYLTKEKPPLFGWTPDCKWPVVYGERGRLRVAISSQEVDSLYQFINTFIFPTFSNGQQLGINYKDDDFGEMLMRGYQLKKEGNKHYLEWSMSYPIVCRVEDIVEKITTNLGPNIKLNILSNWDPVLYDKTSDYVKVLQNAYNLVTGLNAEPVTTTGGTYAKIIPNIIAYGPSFPGQNNIAHLNDEWLDLDDLTLNTEIYMRALYALSGME